MLEALGTVSFEYVDTGAGTYRRRGTACSESGLTLMGRDVDATLNGLVGRPTSGLAARRGGDIDYVIVRENTEGLVARL